MRKRKIDKTRQSYTNEWLAMTPRQHLDQGAAVIGAVLAKDDAVTRSGQLAHAQTHLLAGLLKAQLSGGEVGIPID